MRKPGRGQILENRLVGPREVLGGGDRRVPAKGRGRTAPCRGRSGASWIWATPLTPARARGSSVRATPSLRPPRILKTSLFLQKGGPRKEPSQRTATALFYLIPCGDFQLSPQEFYLSLITRGRAGTCIPAGTTAGRGIIGVPSSGFHVARSLSFAPLPARRLDRCTSGTGPEAAKNSCNQGNYRGRSGSDCVAAVRPTSSRNDSDCAAARKLPGD